jgi:predicted ribosomally synthesized peptide with nif11-like leader
MKGGEKMSIESAKAFIEKAKNDEDFRNRLNGFKEGKERIAFAKTAGFDFTVQEIKQASGAELTDGDLDAVAGGVCAKVCVPMVGDGYIE